MRIQREVNILTDDGVQPYFTIGATQKELLEIIKLLKKSDSKSEIIKNFINQEWYIKLDK